MRNVSCHDSSEQIPPNTLAAHSSQILSHPIHLLSLQNFSNTNDYFCPSASLSSPKNPVQQDAWQIPEYYTKKHKSQHPPPGNQITFPHKTYMLCLTTDYLTTVSTAGSTFFNLCKKFLLATVILVRSFILFSELRDALWLSCLIFAWFSGPGRYSISMRRLSRNLLSDLILFYRSGLTFFMIEPSW